MNEEIKDKQNLFQKKDLPWLIPIIIFISSITYILFLSKIATGWTAFIIMALSISLYLMSTNMENNYLLTIFSYLYVSYLAGLMAGFAVTDKWTTWYWVIVVLSYPVYYLMKFMKRELETY